MAIVYLATDARHQRRVAIKVMRPELGFVVGLDRFLREIQILATLTHPQVLPPHDSGGDDEAAVLRHAVRRRRVPAPAAQTGRGTLAPAVICM